MPRNRSVRLAALGATAQRTASSSYGARYGGPLRRRIVVAALVLVSLAMITGYFRESDDGALHGVQSTAARALEPFQIGAERLVRPFRDAWGWFDGLRDAKSENEELRKEIARLRALAATGGTQGEEAADLGRAGRYARSPQFPQDYRLLVTEVLADPLSYRERLVVSAGTSDGVKLFDPVVTVGGMLAGHVSKVASGAAEVTLISDRSSAVSVRDVDTDAKGSLRGRGPGTPTLLLDRVPKEEVVQPGDTITTAGRLSGGALVSFYPAGIPAGKVVSVDQRDTENFKLVQLAPFGALSGLERLVILLRKRPLPTLP
ncbi:MAG: rod shape-determining protein MreC [Gaiellaceae bacterium]